MLCPFLFCRHLSKLHPGTPSRRSGRGYSDWLVFRSEFECAECGRRILRERTGVARHLREAHQGMGLEEYREKHLTGAGATGVVRCLKCREELERDGAVLAKHLVRSFIPYPPTFRTRKFKHRFIVFSRA